MKLEDFEPVHRENINSLAKEFGEDKRPTVIARYSHQFHVSEENASLNGELSRHVYQRTREMLMAEYPEVH